LSYQSSVDSNSTHGIWIVFALLVFFAWGFQAYTMRFANQTMKAESIFFYMTITAILLSPLALLLTDFSKPINFGFNGPILTALIQTLNSVGALMLVYAFRYGKAIIVSPLTNAVAPIITVIISLSIYKVIPHIIIIIGMTLALIAVFLMALENE
jgi:drug/metabolite transporter (DMT)-like permease